MFKTIFILTILSFSVYAQNSLIIEINEFAKAPTISKTAANIVIQNLKSQLGGSYKIVEMNNDQDGSDLFPIKANILKQIKSKTQELIFLHTHVQQQNNEIRLLAADSDPKNQNSFITYKDFDNINTDLIVLQSASPISTSMQENFIEKFSNFRGIAVLCNDVSKLNIGQLLRTKKEDWRDQIFRAVKNKSIYLSGSLLKTSKQDLKIVKLAAQEAKKSAQENDAQKFAMTQYGSAVIKEKVALRRPLKTNRETYQNWHEIRIAYLRSQLAAMRNRHLKKEENINLSKLKKYEHPQWSEYENFMTQSLNLENNNNITKAIEQFKLAVKTLEVINQDIIINIEELVQQNSKSSPARHLMIKNLIELDQSKKFNYAYHGLELEDQWGIKFRFIEKGSFIMGSAPNEVGRDRDESIHKVTLTKGFYMGTHEISKDEWHKVMNTNPEMIGSDFPVNVSWKEALKFCKTLSKLSGRNYRLPTEAEWEYACRSGTKTAFSSGNYLDQKYAVINKNSAYPRGNTKANAWGLYDMHGNVWEWCQDWSWFYSKEATVDPLGPSEEMANKTEIDMKILRGGSWKDSAENARSANRWENATSYKTPFIGFRLILEPK